MAKRTLIVHPWSGTVLDTEDGILRVELDTDHPQYESDAWVVEQAQTHGRPVT